MRVKKWVSLLVSVVLIMSLLCSCSVVGMFKYFMEDSETETSVESDTQPAVDGNVITSDDGKYEITLSKDWSVPEDQLVEEAKVSAENRFKEKYIAVLSESKLDIADDVSLADYAQLLIENNLTITDMEATTPEIVAVGDMDGYYFEVKGTVDSLKITYFITCVETDTEFVRILGWTLQSKTDQNRDDIKSVSATLKVSAY